MRKAQGLPLNTIIIAALVLIVLVLLVLIFTGRMNIFRKGIETCSGTCQSTSDCANGKIGYYQDPCRDNLGSSPNDKYCCPS